MTFSATPKVKNTSSSLTFLVEILGMTNYCNLRCAYCDWEKKPPKPLTDIEKQIIRQNLLATRELIQSCWPEAPMIEYSGGEPFLYPEIVAELLKIFPDYYIRVVTNGLMLGPHELEAIARHGKTFLAISLDGSTSTANIYRFPFDDLRKEVVYTIDSALDMGIPVMLLCTMNRSNIDSFPQYIQWIHHRWLEQIENGSLVLPAHKLSTYGRYHPCASSLQWQHLREDLEKIDLPGINRIREHYDAMFDTHHVCTIHRWAASLHFLDRAIAEEEGRFTSFRCGMRGIGKIGFFSIKSPQVFNDILAAQALVEQKDFDSSQCYCFVDWTAFDLIFSGVIPMERAAAWFQPFRDSAIQAWITNYQNKNRERTGK